MPTVSNISHNDRWSWEVTSHLPSWVGVRVNEFKKTYTHKTVLLIVIYLLGHKEKLNMWPHAVHMTGHVFAIASVVMRYPVFGDGTWMGMCLSLCQSWGMTLWSSNDDLIPGRIIIPLIWSWDQHSISKNELCWRFRNESVSHLPGYQAIPHIFRWSNKMGWAGQTYWVRNNFCSLKNMTSQKSLDDFVILVYYPNNVKKQQCWHSLNGIWRVADILPTSHNLFFSYFVPPDVTVQ